MRKLLIEKILLPMLALCLLVGAITYGVHRYRQSRIDTLLRTANADSVAASRAHQSADSAARAGQAQMNHADSINHVAIVATTAATHAAAKAKSVESRYHELAATTSYTDSSGNFAVRAAADSTIAALDTAVARYAEAGSLKDSVITSAFAAHSSDSTAHVAGDSAYALKEAETKALRDAIKPPSRFWRAVKITAEVVAVAEVVRIAGSKDPRGKASHDLQAVLSLHF